LIVNPRAHSDGWKPIILYANVGQFSLCCFNCNKAPLYLSNFKRKLRHACFYFKDWKSTVGENQRGILKGTRTEFKLHLYSVISKGCRITKCVFFCFSLLETLNFCSASMTLNGAYGQLSIFCCVFMH